MCCVIGEIGVRRKFFSHLNSLKCQQNKTKQKNWCLKYAPGHVWRGLGLYHFESCYLLPQLQQISELKQTTMLE